MTHTNTKYKAWIFFTVFAVFCCSIGGSLTARAEDYILSQEVVDPNTQVDVCPNIPGPQTALPDGMIHDTNGSCYTPNAPTPPSPPVTIDLCGNQPGIQTTLPVGTYRTSDGRCIAQPATSDKTVDVCQNLTAIQAAVPDNYYLNEANDCLRLPEPTDVCSNIPGAQTTLPTGMKRDNTFCYTPTPTSTTTTPTTHHSSPETSNAMHRIPAFLQSAVQSIVSRIPEPTKQWLRSLPETAAQVVPYSIFLLVAIIALIPILQSISEALYARQIALILQRERGLAQEKDNFVTLASHYLRTPVTLMNGCLDSIVANNELTAEQVAPLTVELSALNDTIHTILQDIATNTALKAIGPPPPEPQHRPVWRSGWFLGPLIGSLVLTLVANFLLVIVGEKEIGVLHTFFQFLVAALACGILYLGVRNLYLQKSLRAEKHRLIDHEKIIDEARNAFITQVTLTLKGSLERIKQQQASIQGAPSVQYFNEGYARIEATLQKFMLLSQIQAGIDRDLETIDLREAVDNLLVTYAPAISAKRLTVSNALPPTVVQQNRLLFNFVLNSVLDNAIKFNRADGTIEIGIEPHDKTLRVTVADSGIGIQADKLDQLFKPFSRTTAAVEFNYDGLGFSLFLDKIIMDYTGGTISIDTQENHGTRLYVDTPLTTTVSTA